MRSVRFSPKAESDLEEIGDFIARDNPRRAVTFIDELIELCELIGRSPDAFQSLPNLGPGIRRAVHGRYAIFYTVHAREVRIERVLHGARSVTEDSFDP